MEQVETKLVQVDRIPVDNEIVAQATAVFRSGGLVAFPTETVYGLGANALSETAVRRIFTAKGRPANDPIIAHIPTPDALPQLATDIPNIAFQLAEQFWPGPLTLVLPKAAHVPDSLTSGGPTVAIRCPNHHIAQALLRAVGTPIGAPSANRFGHTSPTTAQHVLADLDGRIDLIIDGGPTQVGVESTVLDVTQAVPVLLRPGGVTVEALTAVIPNLRQHTHESRSDTDTQPSPGLLERHYAPQTPLWLVTGTDDEIRQKMQEILEMEEETAVGLLLADEDKATFAKHSGPVARVGSLHQLGEVAQNLFRQMRTLDEQPVRLILARDFPAHGLGHAIRDRLRRAADKIL